MYFHDKGCVHTLLTLYVYANDAMLYLQPLWSQLEALFCCVLNFIHRDFTKPDVI